MRTTYFTTHLQAVSGLVEVVSAHHVAGVLQSSKLVADTERQIEQIRHILTHTPPQSPQQAKTLLDTKGAGLDLALLVHHEGSGILITQGTGVIFLKRGGKLTEVVGNGLIAQGPVHEDDECILTTGEFLDLIGGLEGMEYYFLRYTSEEVVEMMKTYEDQSVAAGFVAVLFGAQNKEHIQSVSQIEDQIPNGASLDEAGTFSADAKPTDTAIPQDHFVPDEELEEDELIIEKRPSKIHRLWAQSILGITSHVGVALTVFRKKPKLFLGGGVGLAILLVLLGRLLFSSTTVLPKSSGSFESVRTQIEGVLTSAETEAFVNVPGVEPLIASARSALDALSPSDKRKFKREIEELAQTIARKEQELLRISSSKPTEHFVLTLEASDATVADADFDGETFFLLDSTKGAVYVVSADSRAYVAMRSDKLKNAQAITGLGDDIYVLTAREGIYYVTAERSQQVIKPDSQWGAVTDIKVYAGNIYLLDAKRKNIYKYPGVDEKTFSTATSYLVEEAQGNLESNNRLAIDGFVYSAGPTSVLKFTSGRKADLRLVLPYTDVSISALYTHPDIEKLYVFDATHQALLELSKEGIFDKQWKIPNAKALAIGVSKTGKKFVVTEKAILSVD